MRSLTEFLNRLDSQREFGYALIRIYLGIALFLRGWLLIADPSAITNLTGAQQLYMWYSYIIGGHLIGGMLLTFGLMTRLAALIQIPILLGAVFVVHLKQGLLAAGQSLELSSLVLFLLFVYCVFGSGILSLDNQIGQKKIILDI